MTWNLAEDREVPVAVRYAAGSWADVAGSDTSEDVEQELRLQLLTKPSTRRLLDRLDRRARIAVLTRMAKSIYAGCVRADRVARDEVMFSIESVKDTLKGNPLTTLHASLVEIATLELECRDSPYADALRSRYVDGVVPESKQDENRLVRAHIALTDEVNQAYRRMHDESASYYDGSTTAFPTISDGPRLRDAVEASTRRAKGGHSDPTADAAIALLEADPDERRLLLEETPLAQVLKGNS